MSEAGKMAPLQQETRDTELRVLGQMEAALKRCGSIYEREQCRRAYGRLNRCLQDVVGQRHGLRPMEWGAP